MIRCVVIDDERPAITILKKFIERVPNLKLVAAETNPLVGLEIIKSEKPDVVFLDIQMDEMTGIELASLLSPSINVVFCTAFSDFAVTSYEYNAVDYLMKPINFNRFVKAVHRVSDILTHQATANLNSIKHDYIFIKTGPKLKMQKIDLDDIDYVEAMNNYVMFHYGTQKVMALLTMKEVEDRLPVDNFIRVHKSFIVSLKQIIAIQGNFILFKNCQKQVPIGASFKENFLYKMKRNILSMTLYLCLYKTLPVSFCACSVLYSNFGVCC